MLVLLLILIVITYSHALHSPFVFDDLPNITRNPHIQLNKLSLEELKDAITKSPAVTRPVSNLTFAINYILHKTNVSAYRLINFLIHIINGVLLYSFLSITLQLPINREKITAPTEMAFWATVIWFVHPLHVQSVTYVVQRMNSLATMFYMIAFLAYLKFRLTEKERQKPWMAALAIIAFLLAMGSKEIAITLPIFIFLYEWFFFQDLARQWLIKHFRAILSIVLVLGVMAFVYLGSNPLEVLLAAYSHRDFTLWQRILTEPRVVLHYIDLFLLPHPDRLSLLHEFEISTSLTSPISTMPLFIILHSMVVATILAARKHRLYSFCLLWFFGNLFLESSFIGLEIMFEHRTYLPSMLLGLFFLSIQRFFAPQWLHRSILVALFLLFSFWTHERNALWADKVALWQDCLQKHPGEVRIYNLLGQAHAEKGNIKEALAKYQQALDLDPDNIEAYNNLGIALVGVGRVEAAIDNLKTAIQIDPGNSLTHYNLALAFAEIGYFKDAEHHYNMAHQHSEFDADPHTHNNLGILLSKMGRDQEAIAEFKEIIRIDPYHPEAHNNLGVIYAKLHDYQNAASSFQEALEISGNDPVILNRLGLAQMLQGKYDEAFNNFSAALRIKPDFMLARQNIQRLNQQLKLAIGQ